MADIADLRERLREEWLRKATSSFTCQECGIQANFIDEIIDALDAKDKRIAELEDRQVAAREFVVRHPSLTLIDLAEFDAYLRVADAIPSSNSNG